jgi:hypothetical protein
MNISGVTQTAQVLPSTQPYQSAESQQATNTQMEQIEAELGADAVNFSAQVQTQVMDMAATQFENAANELISSMAIATGVGQTIDLSV